MNHRRLQVVVKKWAAAKLYPRKYAEWMDVSVSTTSISITAALAEAERRVLIGLTDDDRLSVEPNVGPSDQ